MIDDRSESGKALTNGDQSRDQQRQLLELELTKIRNEASAARLEARAAEIELVIRGLQPGVQPDQPRRGETADGKPINAPHLADSNHHRFTSWDDLRRVQDSAKQVSAKSFEQSGEATGPQATGLVTNQAEVGAAESRFRETPEIDAPESDESTIDQTATQAIEQPIVRTDAAQAKVKRPNLLDLDVDQDQPAKVTLAAEELSSALLVDQELADEAESRRRKPAAWLISAVVHVAILLALAAIGIQTQRPKDQVAITGSATEVSEVSMETFEMESSEPAAEPTESAPSEVEYDLSPDGALAITDISTDATPAPPSSVTSSISSSASAAAAVSLKSDSDAKIQFCGVEGGGNHFVYLVDCSSSMKAGFQSARKELLSSIEALTPKQRFYVVFFDAKPDYMRLRDASRDEPRSVFATTENKAALRRWAMRVAMDRGKAPYDPLRFALKLKPDVIFLLSDGEFPQGIEDLLKEENKTTNLFGDRSPISIVHTISYHSKEGESRMRRIAEQNQGQYRHVPQP